MTATLADQLPSEPTVTDPNSPDEPIRPSHPVPAALQPWHDPRPWVGWLVVVGLGILAGFTRFWGLGFPNEKIFDEAYYPVEAQEILRFGYEDNRGYMFIVHPPLGKWLIGWSTDLFGNGLDSAFGWRVFPAVAGCLTVILLARIARRLFRSNLFGAIAGAADRPGRVVAGARPHRAARRVPASSSSSPRSARWCSTATSCAHGSPG